MLGFDLCLWQHNIDSRLPPYVSCQAIQRLGSTSVLEKHFDYFPKVLFHFVHGLTLCMRARPTELLSNLVYASRVKRLSC